jgi:hypothetical protein
MRSAAPCDSFAAGRFDGGSEVFRGHAFVPTMVLWLMAATAGSAFATDTASASDPPRSSTNSSLSEGGYRSSLLRGKFDFGMRLDAPVRFGRHGESAIDPVAAYVAPLPTLSVGLRNASAGQTSAGTLLERALGATAGEQRESKVGLEWKPAPSRLFVNRGLGIHLDGDDRLTMRLRKGSLGIFMQTRF